jgi:hypothetical protein
MGTVAELGTFAEEAQALLVDELLFPVLRQSFKGLFCFCPGGKFSFKL